MKLRFCVPVSLFLLLAACGIAVPPDRLDYVGDWRSEHTSLLITREGRVEYRHERENTKTSLEAPLQRFEGDDFYVGVGKLARQFKVDKRPYQVGADWAIVVDGEMLRKFH